MTEQKPPATPRVLTPEEMAKARAWVKARWTNGDCPFHGPTNWVLGDTMASPNSYAPSGQVSAGGKVYPLIVFTCSICGYTVFVNGLIAGIVPVTEAMPPLETGGDK